MRTIDLALFAWLIALLAACGQTPAASPPTAIIAATATPPAIATPDAEPPPATGYPAPDAAYPAPTAITIEIAPALAEATVVPDAVIGITIGEYQLDAEVVATPEKRSIGLMFRDMLPDNQGMLFVFASPSTGCFWMRNTRIPLSIAFIGEDRRILNIADMQPLDERTQHCPASAALYALEVNQGWFAARGIQAGDTVQFELPDGLPLR